MEDSDVLVGLLCPADHVTRERTGLYEALKRQASVVCIDRYFASVDDVLKSLPASPSLLLQPDPPQPYLPEGLESCPVPTACLHIDTYSETESRARTSLLFDVSVVCHPGYDDLFESRGHPETLVFPHAVRRPLYADPVPTKELDVAMVGRLEGASYSYRRACMDVLDAMGVTLNDYHAFYDYPQMAKLYREAKIGLNVSRDDHLSDANLRCFEVMAGGGLLVTPVPTELTDLGLQDGRHFVGFQSTSELESVVGYYLSHDEERTEIAEAGRRETLKRFTYDVWARRIIERIRKGIPLQAPARNMGAGRAASLYVDYFSKRGRIDLTLYHLRKQRQNPGAHLLGSLAKAGKATLRGWQRVLTS